MVSSRMKSSTSPPPPGLLRAACTESAVHLQGQTSSATRTHPVRVKALCIGATTGPGPDHQIGSPDTNNTDQT